MSGGNGATVQSAEMTPVRPNGVAFPLQDNGKVSTTATAKHVWCAAIEHLDPDLAGEIRAETDWRFQYPNYIARVARLMAASSDAAGSIADRGLAALADTLEYVQDGVATKLSRMPRATAGHFRTATVTGTAARTTNVVIPEKRKNRTHAGADAVKLAQQWADYGCSEASVPAAIEAMTKQPITQVVDNTVFVLLGATSELGPSRTLLELGCTVACISRKGKKLAALLGDTESHAGTLLAPIDAGSDAVGKGGPAEAEAAGACVLSQLPEIIEWLSVLEPGKTMVIDSLVYLDSEANVRACMAMDIICAEVGKARASAPGAGEVVLAYLMSPATFHPTTVAAYEARRTAYANAPFWHSPFGFVSSADEPVTHTPAPGHTVTLPLIDGIVSMQGPNYQLSKVLQQWRVIAAQNAGLKVSANVTPAARTLSVTHSAQAAAGIEGMAFFEPCMAFDPDTVSATMAWLLLHDVAAPTPSHDHPLQVMATTAFHGGMWRCAYKQESMGAYAYIAGKLGYSHAL